MMTMAKRDDTPCGAPLPAHIIFPTIHRSSSQAQQEAPLIIAALPNWKLYRNPFYVEDGNGRNPTSDMGSDHLARYQRLIKALEEQQARDLLLVSSLRSELHLAWMKIEELKAVARRAECEKERMAKAFEKERVTREVAEGVCDQLAREIGKDRAQVEQMRRECERVREEVEEERRMMRIAEAWREERLQMKLADAQRILEKRMYDLDLGEEKKNEVEEWTPVRTSPSPNGGGLMMGWNKQNMMENPHIQRGIKGFVEFSKAVRLGMAKGRRIGPNKAEYQKDLLRQYFRKQRVPVGLSSENLVAW